MKKMASKNFLRKRRHARVRKKVFGTEKRPRLSIYRSNKHIYAQIINDITGETLCAANSLQKEIADKANKEMSQKDVASLVGKAVGNKALQSGIEKVVFDRAGYKYHGRVAALADAAREMGVKF